MPTAIQLALALFAVVARAETRCPDSIRAAAMINATSQAPETCPAILNVFITEDCTVMDDYAELQTDTYKNRLSWFGDHCFIDGRGVFHMCSLERASTNPRQMRRSKTC